MSELHLFILWKNALYKKNEILEDINTKFEILNVYNITWSNKKYSENLSRFYGTKLPDGCEKEKHCGKGTFLLIIVKDNKPKYDYRNTTAGKEYVNINMFDSKTKYRELTGGGHKVHCTNSVDETNHDLTLLLGKNVEDYLEDIKYNKSEKKNKVISINSDLFGVNGFNSVEDMFYVLNNCVKYAVLRNYETLPDEIYVNKHNDIDIICESRENTAYILNAIKAQNLDYRVQYYVKVGDKTANFDLRYIGDRYYDEKLEKDILKNRVWNKKVFYTLSPEDYFYTLLYHALIHKYDFAEDYKQRLMKMKKEYTKEIANSLEKSASFLEEWMIKNRYIATKPVDQTVIYNNNMLEYMEPLVYKKDVEKEQLLAENKLLKEKLFEVENLAKDFKDKINIITNSRTWKYTEFIRKLNRIIKK